MGRECKTCSHPESGAINRALLMGAAIAEVARRYRLQRVNLGYHRRNHLDMAPADNGQGESRCRICGHVEQPEIEKSILAEETDRSIARRFSMSFSTVARHRRSHMARKASAEQVYSLRHRRTGPPCITCRHAYRDAIDRMLIDNKPLAHIAKVFRIHRDTIEYHRDHHLRPSMGKAAQQAQTSIEMARASQKAAAIRVRDAIDRMMRGGAGRDAIQQALDAAEIGIALADWHFELVKDVRQAAEVVYRAAQQAEYSADALVQQAHQDKMRVEQAARSVA